MTNDTLLQIQAGIRAISTMPNISLNEKATFGLIKNKRKIESELKPYNEAKEQIWKSHGATVSITNPTTGEGVWVLPGTLTPDEKAETEKTINASLKSLAEEECKVELHIVKFEHFKSEENKIPVAIIDLIEPMIDFGE